MTSVRWIRWAMVAVGITIGAVLISQHDVLIGVLILVMAVLRAGVLVTMQSRRSARQSRRQSRFGPPT